MQTCRFCMHSYIKSQKIQGYVNDYCPLDLFSGNADRIRKAVDCLWKAWVHSDGNMNNLKVFTRGETVRPNQVSSVHSQIACRGVLTVYRSSVYWVTGLSKLPTLLV